MTETKELAPLKAQMTKLETQVTALTITNADENVAAIELKAKLKTMGQTIKERKEEITKPLNAALKSARELFSPLETQVEEAEGIVGKKLLDYKRIVDAEKKAEEDRIAAKLEEDKKKLEAEIAAGNITAAKADLKLEVKEEKAIEKLNNLETVNKTTQTAHGQVQFRKIKKVRVTDENLIPRNYLVVDMVAIRKDALAGVQIPGAEVYEEETV